MLSCLESQALRAVIDEGSQDFSQSSNKSEPGDNLMATQEVRIPFPVSDD